MTTRIPSATYRLQLTRRFTFGDAAEVVSYLARLGVSDCYLSPVSRARPGSTHGYDVIDHGELNPELGGAEAFQRLAAELRGHDLGVLLDVVPNHMCIAGSWNARWLDLLENGPSARSARFFDVDWRPPKPELAGKVLLPVLGEQYGRALEEGVVSVSYDEGTFFLTFYENRLPLGPRTWTHVLEPALADLRRRFGDEEPPVLELESIIRALGHLPARTETSPARIREREHERAIIVRRLAALVNENGDVREAIDRAVRETSGQKGEPRSFDRLEALLRDQAYRLSHWRVAADEINYRRFFDVNDLAAVRVEDPLVFEVVHRLPLALAREGVVTGLRIDHVDGLYDPEKYLRDLQRGFRAALGQQPPGDALGYVVVEKILAQDERLPAEWPVQGTTGYELLNLLSSVLVDGAGVRRLREAAAAEDLFEGRFSDIAYQSKKLILASAMSAELTVLARRLDRISEQHRYTRDFTRNGLLEALAEVAACFPVYRTYIRPDDTSVSERDRQAIESAIRSAKRRNPVVAESLFDFLRRVLLLETPGPDALGEAEREERREFVLRFQQLTGPVMAKGLEDTSFYRYFPLAALAEVGGDPAASGVSIEEFHRRNRARAESGDHGLNATATHDTKRGEDTRARLLVLAEVPGQWGAATARWRQLLADRRTSQGGIEAPSPAEEYLFFQTLVGAWPAGGLGADPDFPRRVRDYMIKALLEAKVNTSWINRNEGYEAAVDGYVQAALDPGRSLAFLEDVGRFQAQIAPPGYHTALAQLLLKLTAPGVPDLYQGTELWDLSLVDPDNRRAVDFALRRRLLDEILAQAERDPAALCDRLLAQPDDGRVKLFLMSRILPFRRARAELFERAGYEGLAAAGQHASGVIAFARALGPDAVVAVTGRHFARLCEGGALPVGAAWGDTVLRLPPSLTGRRFRDVVTGLPVLARGDGTLAVSEVLAHLPVALLEASL